MISFSALNAFDASVVKHSPNSDVRPAHVRGISCVVLHATADGGDEAGAEAWLSSAASQVSAHLHIRRDGTIVRLVSDVRRAWHCGRSSWRGIHDVNDFSLGWEMANRNDGRERYTDAQYESVTILAAHYIAEGLTLKAFLSHAEVALPPGRKDDPRAFDWPRFVTMLTATCTATPGPSPSV